MHSSEIDKYVCRVCGFVQDAPPWGDDGNTASFDICPCCGVEFGYEDVTRAGTSKFRKEWIAGGAKWFSPKKCPPNWNLETQLKNVPPQFRVEQ